MKVVNQVKWYLQEVRGDRLNAIVKEMELLADFAAWVDKKAAQQSVQSDFCPRCGGSKVIQANFTWVDCPNCVTGKSR